MESAHRVVKNTGILYLKMLITFPITLYTTRVLLEALGVDDFGLFFLVAGIISMFMFLNASLSTATQRFMSYAHGEGKEQKQNAIYNIAVKYHFIVALLVCFILSLISYPLINNVLTIDPNKLEQAFIVFLIAIANVFIVINTVPLDASINANERMDLFAKVAIAEAVLKLLIALIIIEIESEYRLVIYACLFTIVTLIVYGWKLFYSHLNFVECQFNLKTKQPELLKNEMVKFAGWSLVGTSGSMIAFYGQGLVLNFFFGTAANAAHAIAYQLNGQLASLANNMMRAVNPLIVKCEGAQDRHGMLQASMMAAKMSTILMSLLFIPFAFQINNILDYWLITVPEFAVLFCIWVMSRTLLEQLYLPLVTSIDAKGDIKRYQVMYSAISISALLISFLILYSGSEPYTIYITYFFSSFFVGISAIYIAKIKVDLSITIYINKVILRTVLTLLISSFFISLLSERLSNGVFELLIYFFFSGVIIMITSWLVGFDHNDKRLIKRYLWQLYNKVRLLTSK